MARRRRPAPHTSVVDGQAQIVIPIDSVVDPDGKALAFGAVTRWLPQADSFIAPVDDAAPGTALVLDRFAWDLHLGDIGHATDVHDGDSFFAAATSGRPARIYVVDGLDPRRCPPAEIEAAARAGSLAGALVTAFAVDVLES